MLIELRLKGVLYSEEMEVFNHLKDLVRSRFLYCRMDISDLHPSPDDDGWISALPVGVLQDTALRLRHMSDDGAKTRRQSQIASLALMELYAMTSEVLR